jgi:hypothetical protein
MNINTYARYVNRTVVALAVGALFGTGSLYADRDNQSLLTALGSIGFPVSQAYSASLVAQASANSPDASVSASSVAPTAKTMQSQINLPSVGSNPQPAAAPASPIKAGAISNAVAPDRPNQSAGSPASGDADYHFLILIKRLDALQTSVDQANAEIAQLKATTIESTAKADSRNIEFARTLEQIKQFASKVEELSKLSSIVNKIQQAQQKAVVAPPKPVAAAAPPASRSSGSAASSVSNKEFKIISASSDYLVITQNGNTKKVETGSELPNGATFNSFDGKQIVTSAGSYLVQ